MSKKNLRQKTEVVAKCKFKYFANLKFPHCTVNFSSGGHVQKMHFPNVEIRFYSTIQAAASQAFWLLLCSRSSFSSNVAGTRVSPVKSNSHQFCTRTGLVCVFVCLFRWPVLNIRHRFWLLLCSLLLFYSNVAGTRASPVKSNSH